MILPEMYHWAPADRRRDIFRSGLQVLSDSLSCQVLENPATGGVSSVRWPYICMAPTPKGAWLLSADTGWGRDEDTDWDLWQVTLAPQDEVHILPQWGNEVKEIRVHNTIPGDRVWYVGTQMHTVEEIPA